MINELQEDLKQAMRDKDSTKLNVLRSLKTAITNASLQKGNVNESLTEVEILGIIRKQVSQRQDSINAYASAQRQDLILIENSEIEILNKYLPEEMTDSQLATLIHYAISELYAKSKKDMGNVIKHVVAHANGCVDNRRISKMVGEILQ
jgi:uncharacterized protein YqeY